MEKSANFDRPFPALRPTLEAVPIDHEGQQRILLRETEEATEQAFVVSPAGMLIASLLDGRRTVADIRTAFQKEAGWQPPEAEILQLVDQLLSAGLLDTEETRAARRAKREQYLSSSSRPMAHVGGGYPADRSE